MGALDSTCGMKADPACRWLPIVMDHFPPVKWHPKKYRCWEGDDERNTGHLGKKKCFINSVGKRERVLSQTESLQVSSSFDSTVGQCDEWASSGKRKEATLPHRAYSEQYSYCSPSNKSSRKCFICQNALGRSWITKHVQLKGVKITPRNRWGSCSWGTSYLLPFVDSIL